jgi:hypothetical protein
MKFAEADAEFAKLFREAVKSGSVDQIREVMWNKDPFVTVDLGSVQRHLLFTILPLKKATENDLLMADVVFRTMLRKLKDKPAEFLQIMADLDREAGMSGFSELREYVNRKTNRLFPARFDQNVLNNELRQDPNGKPDTELT